MNFLVLTKAGSILGPIATVFGYIMDVLFKFTSSFNCYNLGICIILFTVITKVLLFPLTIKQQEN
ncbi:MAG TPA: preprotein translocase YidC, partial [Lachnospiraceae bacterium]|nr:preprotein translocase YidC [Lachnospiraceae bacterium]